MASAKMESNVRNFEVSPVVSVKEFLSSWSNDIYQECATSDDIDETSVIAEKMELTVENVQELHNVCSLDHLRCGEEPLDKWKLLEKVPPNLDLMMARFQKGELERRQSPSYRNNIFRKMKYRISDDRMLYDSGIGKVVAKTVPQEFQVVYPDVVLTVHCHRPYTNWHDKGERGEQLTIDNTFLVLGRQKLTDLRDSIRCVNDLTVAGDLSEDPDSKTQRYAKDIFKSGFIFIEDTFYNDMREDDCKDYSKPIRDWASEPGRRMGPYETQNMEHTTFLDLKLRLGQPYVYQHQGDCEHVLIFSDIKLLTTHDSQDVREYPYLIKKTRRNRVLCRVCLLQASRWITYGSQFAPEDPCFFCEQCFRSLHYDLDGKKIGKFEAYKYFDHHAIV